MIGIDKALSVIKKGNQRKLENFFRENKELNTPSTLGVP